MLYEKTKRPKCHKKMSNNLGRFG